ncbi:hypothetical protein NNL21_17815 [Paenibacillus mendelii]|nr:hypothetical protein [Paenibacillus mendelii]
MGTIGRFNRARLVRFPPGSLGAAVRERFATAANASHASSFNTGSRIRSPVHVIRPVRQDVPVDANARVHPPAVLEVNAVIKLIVLLRVSSSSSNEDESETTKRR